MKFFSSMLFATMLAASCASLTAFAGDTDPLFINMTSDDGHRATMAIGFGAKQQARGHPLTVFLNDKGVLVASKVNGAKYAEQQKVLAGVIAQGGMVIVCPLCMKHYGVKESDLMSDFKIGSPDLTGAALFKDNTKTLTW